MCKLASFFSEPTVLLANSLLIQVRGVVGGGVTEGVKLLRLRTKPVSLTALRELDALRALPLYVE